MTNDNGGQKQQEEAWVDVTCSCPNGDGWVEGMDGRVLPYCAVCGKPRLWDSVKNYEVQR